VKAHLAVAAEAVQVRGALELRGVIPRNDDDDIGHGASNSQVGVRPYL